jgi:hypothetical protein
MSTTVGYQLTDEQRELVTSLYRSDDATQGQPQLPADQVERAREYLALLLVDGEAEMAHTALLKELYRSPFRYPLERPFWWEGPRDWSWDPPRPPVKIAPGFRHNRFLSRETARAVAERGPGILSPEELAALLLNPYALWDLGDLIDFMRPDYWRESIERNAQEWWERSGMWVPIPGLDEQPPPGWAERHAELARDLGL